MKKYLKKLIIPILLITGLLAVRVCALTFTSKSLNLTLSTLGDSILEVTHNYKSIFDEDYQKNVDKKIKQQIKNNSYTLESPLLIYNPYGTNTLSLNIYFHDDKALTLSYLIEVDGEENFEKKAYEEDTSDHAIQLIGLVPEKKNTITITATYEDGSIKEKEITLIAPSLNNETDLNPKVTDGESTEEISDGLFAVLGHDKNFNANIYLFDNNGTIRSELVLNGYRADRIEMMEEGILYSSSKNTLIVVDRLGKITKQYYLDGYEMHHDFIYDEENNKVLILANKKETSTIEDRVIALDLDTSEVKEIINLQDYLKESYENASMPTSGKNAYGGDSLDWLHLNSLSLTEAGDLILSSRELSTIIKMRDIYTNPTLDYLLADTSVYENTTLTNRLLTKIGVFVDSAGQHTVTYSKEEGMEDGTYYLSFYNNNYKGADTRSDFDWKSYPGTGTYSEGDKSLYYKYLVDENKRTYTLVNSIELPYSSIVSSIQNYQDHLITSSGKSTDYREYDKNGILIRSYSYNAKTYAYRVFKYHFNQFWFTE